MIDQQPKERIIAEEAERRLENEVGALQGRT